MQSLCFIKQKIDSLTNFMHLSYSDLTGEGGAETIRSGEKPNEALGRVTRF